MTLAEVLISDEAVEPETIRQLFPSLSEKDIEKIHAARTVLHTRYPFEDFYIFEDVVLALNNETPDFTTLQGCTPEQIWYGVYMINKLRPNVEFSWEVHMYCKMMCNEGGVYIYPPQLTDLPNPYYERAKELAAKGEVGEESIETIQAAKYLAIQHYMNTMRNKALAEWR